MKNKQIQLFHNKYRYVVYYPESRKLTTHWFGHVPESEQIQNMDYILEWIKIYNIEHIVVDTKKVKTISLRPTRIFIETVLTKAYQKGAKTLTIIQKAIKDEAFVLNAYVNALKSYGIGMKIEFVKAHL